MYAPEKVGIAPSLPKVGIIAGNGDLPDQLSDALRVQGIEPVVARLGVDFGVGQAGAIMAFFKNQSVTDLVMVGGLRRPNWLTLKVDGAGLRIVARVLFRKVGDDGLLRVVREALESEGFHVHGIQRYMPMLLAPEGVLGRIASPIDALDLERGIAAAKDHGAKDLGQSVVMVDGKIQGFETRDGTNALMRQMAGVTGCKILFKASKPQQDLDLDLPTIGRRTIDTAVQCGFNGIAVEAGRTLFLDRDYVVEQADRNGLFVIGLASGEVSHD